MCLRTLGFKTWTCDFIFSISSPPPLPNAPVLYKALFSPSLSFFSSPWNSRLGHRLGVSPPLSNSRRSPGPSETGKPRWVCFLCSDWPGARRAGARRVKKKKKKWLKTSLTGRRPIPCRPISWFREPSLLSVTPRKMSASPRRNPIWRPLQKPTSSPSIRGSRTSTGCLHPPAPAKARSCNRVPFLFHLEW